MAELIAIHDVLEGFDDVLAETQGLWKKSRLKNNKGVVVGFATNYALPVHENLSAQHEVGEAEYLLKAAGEHAETLNQIVKKTFDVTGTLETGLLLAGLRLQREAQEKTPIDTGALRGSAFTARESDLEEAAKTAEAVANAIREKELAKRASKRK